MPDALAADTLAVVTAAGNGLRVRTAPGLGEDSLKLEPLLASGTRMLVISGPVLADGYDWYEVQTDGEAVDLYGWVAAHKKGVAWIAPTAPHCPGSPAIALARANPIDFLVCYGGTEITIVAHWNEAQNGADLPPCPWVDHGIECDLSAGWLFPPASHVLTFESDGRSIEVIAVAEPPGLQPRLEDVPGDAAMTLTVAADHPDAASCAVLDPRTGKDLVPRNRAITACRLTPVVRSVSWDAADLPPLVSPITVVRVEHGHPPGV